MAAPFDRSLNDSRVILMKSSRPAYLLRALSAFWFVVSVFCVAIPASAEEKALPEIVVPLSSAFTLDGYGTGLGDRLFTEYVLHVSRSEAGAPMRVTEWSRPPDETVKPAKFLVTTQGAALDGWRRHTVLSVEQSAPSKTMQAAAEAKPLGFIQRWVSYIPTPNLAPVRQKVSSALTLLGEKVTSAIPRF